MNSNKIIYELFKLNNSQFFEIFLKVFYHIPNYANFFFLANSLSQLLRCTTSLSGKNVLAQL